MRQIAPWHWPLIVVCSALLADTSTGQSPADNLLENPGAEVGDGAPAGWQRSDPPPGVEFVWADAGAGGDRSLGLAKTVERYFPIAQWTQTLPHEDGRGRVHVGALIKASKAHKAVIDVQFEDAQGGAGHCWAAYVGATRVGDPPADHDWQWYSGVVAVPEGTRRLRVALQIYGPGQVWFDDVLARYVAEDVAVTDALKLSPQPAVRAGALPVGAEAPPSPEATRIDDDEQRQYFLHGPAGEAPADGFKLLLVLPGGDGSAEFRPFVQSIARHAAPPGYLVAQLVAPRWGDDADRIVWPTRKARVHGMKFTTEEFIAAVVADVAARHPIDRRKVFALGWSSGGPPCYSASLTPKTPLAGCMVAMSVFKPKVLPALRGAVGKAYYVLHSPQDFIPMRFAEDAVRRLAKAGAETVLVEYEGGHGWHGDPHAQIRAGLEWLETAAQ